MVQPRPVTRRVLVRDGALIAGLAAFASCPPRAVGAAQETTPDEGSSFSYPEFDPPLPLLDLVTDGGTTVTVRDAFGEVDIPKAPRRIVTLDPIVTDVFLALGLPPIAADADADGAFHRFMSDRMQAQQVAPIPTGYEPDLELVLTFDPDLIMAAAPAEESLYQNLSKIAPTIALRGNVWVHWRQALRDLGTALDVADRAESAIADYEEAVAQARSELPAGLRDGRETVGVLLVQGQNWRLYGFGETTDGHFWPAAVTQVPYADLRLIPPRLVQDDPEFGGYTDISSEIIPLIDADHLVVIPWEGGGAFSGTSDTLTAMAESPLWAKAPAVAKGQVYVLENDWALPGPVNVYQQLAELVAALTSQA